MEIRRIRQTEAEAVTDLWDEAGQSIPDGGAPTERGRRNIAAMLVLAASSHRAACFVDEAVNGFVLAELELGESADVVESLGFQPETSRFGLYRE